MTTAIEIDVRNPSGLHARPAAVFVKAAAGFRADIRIANMTTGGAEVNAKSILAVLSVGASAGHRIRLCAEGDDEAEAARVLADLVSAGLGEPASGGATG
jgi:phosphotransferase system HPr (HPr) family protein